MIRVNTVDTSTLSILIADDHPLFRDALQQILSQRYPDATVYTAASVSQLQQRVEAHPDIGLLLLDLHMPGALGFSALSWFIGHHRDTPVIMISANSHPRYGATRYRPWGSRLFIQICRGLRHTILHRSRSHRRARASPPAGSIQFRRQFAVA